MSDYVARADSRRILMAALLGLKWDANASVFSETLQSELDRMGYVLVRASKKDGWSSVDAW